ncbi:uncharacterized protein LOC120091963 isoform X2 [Benincasa hispida]|uniref:uncharacterized protein LOC120091963 isoform X2 n=1 Tax=Benincasa hispida TaxID=102211 RepID=UPI0019006027|nr:uncharacterized protein LOC120091963 isoform X2 [Benincasa hispida]
MADNKASQDLRKHALEALERRCAAAKVELLQQQKKISSTEKLKKEVKGKSTLNDSISVVSRNQYDSSILLPSEGKPPNVNESDPIYFTLSAAVNEKLMATTMDVSNNRGRVVDRICHELRTSGYIKRSKEFKVDACILLDNFVPKRAGMIGSRKRALRSNSKRSKRHMSMRQHKKCGTFDLPSDFHKFEIFWPMHDMWKSYMKQRLHHVGGLSSVSLGDQSFKSCRPDALARNLLIADLHGAMIRVVECQIPAFTGTSGIMIRETAETFGIVTKDDKFRVVPKKSSVFIFQWDCWKVTLLGDKLSSRIPSLPSSN